MKPITILFAAEACLLACKVKRVLIPEDLTPQMLEEFTRLYRRWRSGQH